MSRLFHCSCFVDKKNGLRECKCKCQKAYILFLVTAALLINDDLISINVSVRKLKALQTDVTTQLNNINTTITTSCASVPGGCSSVDTSSLSFNPDFSGVSI